MAMQISRRSAILGSIGGFAVGRGFVASGYAATTTPEADEAYAPEIDPARFSTTIDNPFFPLIPGTEFHFEGEEDGEKQTETITVLSDTREVMGVTCVVVRDVVMVDGDPIEDTLDWYAQDDEGNVWYFGEDSKDIEDGEVVSTHGSWESGVDGAFPGIMMLAHPAVGDTYREEYYAGEAEDGAEVISIDETVSGPTGDYSAVLMTENTTPLEPDVVERKWYAAGVGLIREELISGGEGVNELVQVDEAEDDGSPEAEDDDASPEAEDDDENGDESEDPDY